MPSRRDQPPESPSSAPELAPLAAAPDILPQLAIVALATLAAYSNSLRVPFHFDDFGVVLGNRALREPALLWPPLAPRWLGDVTFALNYALGGTEAIGYHVVNVLLHVANALLVFALARTTFETPALRTASAGRLLRPYLPVAAALVFALHPLATQAVTYVAQRYAALATLLYVAAVLLYARALLRLEAGPAGRVRGAVLYGLALLAALGAVKSKQIAFTLPVAVAGYELLCFPGRSRRRLLLALPFAAIALLVPLSHAAVEADLERVTAETATIPRLTYLLTQTRVVVSYLRLLVLPVGQNLDPDVALSDSLADPRVLGALAILAAVAGLAVWRLLVSRRAGRAAGQLLFLGVAWFFVTLSVESSIIPIRDVMMEHRVYLPSVGAAIALATALLSALEALRLPGSPAVACAAALAVTAGPLGVATFLRNRVWQDELSLWSDVVAKSPGKSRPHNYLGIVYGSMGDSARAMAEFQEALRLAPWSCDALLNLAGMYRKGGDRGAALRLYQKAVLVAPERAIAHSDLGAMYMVLGRLAEAQRELDLALRLDPRLPEALANAARLRARLAAPPAR
jgi:tetratricopeptide (TPR) repeat protein